MEREESYRLCPACDDGNCIATKHCSCCRQTLCAGCWREHYEAGSQDRLGFVILALGLVFYAGLGTVLTVYAAVN